MGTENIVSTSDAQESNAPTKNGIIRAVEERNASEVDLDSTEATQGDVNAVRHNSEIRFDPSEVRFDPSEVRSDFLRRAC
jgi:hypothetical protein